MTRKTALGGGRKWAALAVVLAVAAAACGSETVTVTETVVVTEEVVVTSVVTEEVKSP